MREIAEHLWGDVEQIIDGSYSTALPDSVYISPYCFSIVFVIDVAMSHNFLIIVTVWLCKEEI